MRSIHVHCVCLLVQIFSFMETRSLGIQIQDMLYSSESHQSQYRRGTVSPRGGYFILPVTVLECHALAADRREAPRDIKKARSRMPHCTPHFRGSGTIDRHVSRVLTRSKHGSNTWTGYSIGGALQKSCTSLGSSIGKVDIAPGQRAHLSLPSFEVLECQP